MRRRLDLWHPSDDRLRHWLDTGEPDGVGEHVDRCVRCADRLEEIDSQVPTPLSLDGPSLLRQALTEWISPPPDLNDRVLQGVVARHRAEREMMLIAGLFSVGVETAQLLLDPHTSGTRGDEEREKES